MIADLDETIRQLLKEELPIKNSEIEVSFEQPKRENSARWTKPTVNLFLYDVRENNVLRQHQWQRLIEGILAKPYNHQLLADRDNGYGPDMPDHGPYAMEGAPATIEWEVHDNFPVPGTKRISITVRPRPGAGGGTLAPTIFEYVKAREQ